MATRANVKTETDASNARTKTRNLWGSKPNWFDYLLSLGCVLLFTAVILALLGGREQFSIFPFTYYIHFSTLLIALALTPLMLLREKGTPTHRKMGYVWLSAMLVTSIVSLFIRDINSGSFSPIHILSVMTILQCWRIWTNARSGNHHGHRRQVYILITFALLLAGFFTFQFDRLFDRWLSMAFA